MIVENGKREVEIAKEKNRFVMFNGQMYPWCPAEGDGGWCKRSYGHSYNAKSGVVSSAFLFN